jgi:hypothetical protein
MDMRHLVVYANACQGRDFLHAPAYAQLVERLQRGCVLLLALLAQPAPHTLAAWREAREAAPRDLQNRSAQRLVACREVWRYSGYPVNPEERG